MGGTTDWTAEIHDFLARHRAACLPFGWPDESTDAYLAFASAWVRHLTEIGATLAEADAASEQLAGCPPPHTNEHLSSLKEVIADRRKPKVAPSPTSDMNAWAADWREKTKQDHSRIRRLADYWDAMAEDERKDLWDFVAKEHPGLAPFPPLMRRMCLLTVEQYAGSGEVRSVA
jgi:hypothetical protein